MCISKDFNPQQQSVSQTHSSMDPNLGSYEHRSADCTCYKYQKKRRQKEVQTSLFNFLEMKINKIK